MPIREIQSQETWSSIEDLVEFLIQSRDNRQTTNLRMGINHAIILYSACYVESVMEQVLKTILARRRKVFNRIKMSKLDDLRTTNFLFAALEEDIRIRISRSTGIVPYLDLIRLLTDTTPDTTVVRNEKVARLLEGTQVLFAFRNVLAHGREVYATRLSAYWIQEPWQESFSGGYKQAEQYLIKLRLLDRPFMDSDKIDLFFTDSIADHFWTLARDFITAITKSLEDKDRRSVIQALSQHA